MNSYETLYIHGDKRAFIDFVLNIAAILDNDC